ncbi:hypothetical protein ACFLY8_05970 [Halobacteriota archaeon]
MNGHMNRCKEAMQQTPMDPPTMPPIQMPQMHKEQELQMIE